MLRRGVLRAAAYAQPLRPCTSGGCGVNVGTRAWLSSTPGVDGGATDDPTPAETKLAFASSVYGKDPAAAAELTAAEVAAAAQSLKQAAAKPGGGVAPTSSKGHDSRAMFDSTLSQQAEDGKASADIKRDVSSDTPDATRVAFRASAYGKDSQAAAAMSADEAAELEALRVRAQDAGAVHAPSGAAPVHDSRNMFDSDLAHGAGASPASHAIKRDVTADTPDATRVAFWASVYGKDPHAAAELSAQDAAEVEALRKGAVRGGGLADAAPVHDSRNMFDSDLSHGAGTSPASDAIKREVATDTPDATRVAFRASVYGKDPQAASELSAEEAADVDALRKNTSRAGGLASGAAPIHDSRNMFDSDLSHGAGSMDTSDAIKRDVAADTPDATRVAFRASVYGKDPQAAAELSAQEAAGVEALRKNTARVGGLAADAAPIHHTRSMFDSDLVHSAGATNPSDAIKREVKADTPEVTRLVFGGSDYGKDQRSITRSVEEQAEMDALAAQTRSETAKLAQARRTQAPVHHDRSMFDSDLTQGAGAVRDSAAIKRSVETNTPDLTRLSFFGSTYGDGAHGDEKVDDAKELAAKQARGAKLATVGRGARKSKVHDTKKAMADDEYSQAGSE